MPNNLSGNSRLTNDNITVTTEMLREMRNSMTSGSGTARWHQTVRNFQAMPAGSLPDQIEVNEFDELEEDTFNGLSEMELIKEEILSKLGRTHLRQDDRRLCHNPANDWELVGDKEVCKSASTLYVEDIVEEALASSR